MNVFADFREFGKAVAKVFIVGWLFNIFLNFLGMVGFPCNTRWTPASFQDIVAIFGLVWLAAQVVWCIIILDEKASDLASSLPTWTAVVITLLLFAILLVLKATTFDSNCETVFPLENIQFYLNSILRFTIPVWLLIDLIIRWVNWVISFLKKNQTRI